MSVDWVEVSSLADGTYPAAVTSAQKVTTSGGYKAIEWTFEVEGRLVRLIQTMTGPRALDLHDTVAALGLEPRRLRLSDAIGRRCRVVIKNRPPWVNIDQVKGVS